MADEALTEIHRQHRTGQDKYTYFLLAVTASAVAFTVQKTDGLKITYSLLPLGVAILLWGLSFYFGIKNLLWVQTSIYANYSLLQLQKGVYPEQPDHPQMLEAAIRGVRSAIESNVGKSQFYGVWQFRLLIAGAVLFLVWHVLEMALRTYAP
ncbi:hypothetical protein KKE26_01120 [bacterium]|nr:hypothetical protein [bacterium]MBU1753197.1 hypothetical protein [bacterium]